MKLLAKPEYGFCRGLAGHRWKLVTLAPSRDDNKRRMDVTLGCDNCGARRTDTVAVTSGEVVGRGYVYSQGYIVKQEKGEQLGTRKQRARAEYLGWLMRQKSATNGGAK